MQSYIQAIPGPAMLPPMTQTGISTRTLEVAMARKTPAAKGIRVARVSRSTKKKRFQSRSSTWA